MVSVTDTVNVQLLPCPPGRASFASVYWDAVYGIHLELWFTEGSEWRKLYLKTQSKMDIDPNFGGSVKKHWTWQEVKSSQIPFIYWIYTILSVFSEERWNFSDVVRHPRYNFYFFFYAGFCVLLGRSCLLQKLICATQHIFSSFSVSVSEKLVIVYRFQSSVCGWPEDMQCCRSSHPKLILGILWSRAEGRVISVY